MPSSSTTCQHCGSPIPADRNDAYCCAGCAYVHDLLVAQGLDRYYDLKGSLPVPPVSPQALRERDYEWLRQLAEAAAADKTDAAELRLAVQGLSCIGCVWLVERVFSRHPGGLRIMVDVVQGETRVTWQPGAFDIAAFARDLQAFGYLLGPPRQEGERKQASGLERRMAVCGAFAMNAMAFSLPAYFGMPPDFVFASWFEMITAVSATLAMLVGGTYFMDKAWRSLRAGVLHIDTPIALGIMAAYAGSIGGWVAGVESLMYFDFVAVFTFLMLLGRWTQQAAVERNRRRLMRDTSIPDQVRVVAPGKEPAWLPVTALQAGMKYEVKAGQTVPVASKLLSTHSSVSLEWINGESEAQTREEGQLLPSGALNIGGQVVEAEAVENWEASTLRRLLEARRGEEYRDQRLERLLRWYLAVVIVIGICGAAFWYGRGAGLAQALQVMISIFVVSCPCALGVAIPLAEELAVNRAGRLGVFVRAAAFWKRLLRVRRVVFDKTGTLTLENPAIQNRDALASLSPEARTALRSLVSGNLHPVSRSLFDAVGPGDTWAGEVTEIVGHGLRISDPSGQTWSLGRPGAFGASADTAYDSVLALDGKVIAGFSFREALREESVEEVARLTQRGLQVRVLSGDREAKVADIAAQLHLPADHWLAGMTPEQKAQWVARHDQDDTLYIGDGANDSLAFDAALCAGSPVTGRSFLEQKADFFFLGHSLRFVSGLIDVAAMHRRATRRVFGFSVLYNLATVTAGLMGHLSPVAAAILMPLSSLVTLGLVTLTFGRGAAARRALTSAPTARNVPPNLRPCPALPPTAPTGANPCLPM
jgi:Cu2+-exporting ATPase